MPWAFGPILTAGVALGAAAVVVANPVVVPRADVQIPVADLPETVTWTGHRGSAVDMLDEDFIRAVGPAPTASPNPLAVLTDLVRVLVADAADLGRTAILHAFATGARVVADPALTSTSYPYFPAVPSDPAAMPWPGPIPPTTDAGDLGPVVAQALTAILADVGDVSAPRAIVAAFAAGAALAIEPVLGVVESVQRDLRGVLVDTAAVVDALPRPREVIGDGIRTVFNVLPLIDPVPVAVPPASAPASDADAPSPDSSGESAGSDDVRVTSPLTDRRTRQVDDGLGEPAIKPVVDDEISVTDEPGGWSPSGVADALGLGLGQLTQRESGEAASPARTQRTGRTVR